jgi:hypothetical protein
MLGELLLSIDSRCVDLRVEPNWRLAPGGCKPQERAEVGDPLLERASPKSLASATDEVFNIVGDEGPETPRTPLVTEMR